VCSHRHAIAGFLRWLGKHPHEAEETDVRDFLQLMLDGGAQWSWVSATLSAIRTAFDRLCGRNITERAMPTAYRRVGSPILSPREIVRLLIAAPSLGDKLLLGLLYATGSRPSDVLRLRWRDFEISEKTVAVRGGCGSSRRRISLPQSFRPLLARCRGGAGPEQHVFGSGVVSRCASLESVHSALKRAFALARIRESPTPGTLRRTFAAHILDHGADIRFILKTLGDVHLHETTLYTHESELHRSAARLHRPPPRATGPRCRMHIEMRRTSEGDEPRSSAVAALVVIGATPTRFERIQVHEEMPGWFTVLIPPLEEWSEPLSQITEEQRLRFQESAFYALLRRELARRFIRIRAC
jgi:site-specific recombinase XerD